MKAFLNVLLAFLCPVTNVAHDNRVIEPAILEVRYDSWQKEHDDSYILRVGKTVNQFFSFYENRDDSLIFFPYRQPLQWRKSSLYHYFSRNFWGVMPVRCLK